MANAPYDRLPDYPKWLLFYGKKKHLPIQTISRLAQSEYGGSINTWKDRFSYIQNNSLNSKLAKHHQDRDEKFLEFIGLTGDYKAPQKQHQKNRRFCHLTLIQSSQLCEFYQSLKQEQPHLQQHYG